MVVKLRDNVEKQLEICEKDDLPSTIHRFCKENNLSEDLIIPIVSKIYLSFDYYNELQCYSLNDEVESVFKEAFDIYNNKDRIRSMLDEETGEPVTITEEKRKRGCSV